jgi:hypothetical protein
MKNVVIVLASGVVAGLVVYAFLEWQQLLGLVGESLTMRIATFVASLAAVGFGSAALALGFRAAFQREDGKRVRALEERVGRLEKPPAGA